MSRDARKLNEPPKRSVLEEVGNAVTHGVGALFSIAGLVLLILRSDTSLGLFCAIIYGLCLVIMFLMSCLYHSFRWGSGVKRLWRRFDYISIYLLIGGTFTPMWLLFWRGNLGTILCCLYRRDHSLRPETERCPFSLAFLRILRCCDPLVRHLFLPLLICYHNNFVLFT